MTQTLYQLGWILTARPSKQAAAWLQAVRVHEYSLGRDIVMTLYLHFNIMTIGYCRYIKIQSIVYIQLYNESYPKSAISP